MSVEDGMNAATFQRIIDEALPFASDMEMEVVHLSPGNITLRMPCRDNALRPGGTISGPAMMGLADTAMYGLWCTVSPLAALSASLWLVRCKARSRRNGRSLSRERNAADVRPAARPKGAPQERQCCVAVLAKGAPLPADCALPWRSWGALKAPSRVKQYTS
ncbi:PaaI family thioesterase [Thioalbus denitrificans]|uniref:PaaI family thioesterase n=1 Tax=Thioalbus denitrificans TaxID=547122 RepID=UPI001B86D2F7|nr:PaaI family thioesterase [Thioalbus denitrificans]